MMIDMHCHVLFGLDDGAKTTEDSTEMFRVAHQDGIKKVVATSHCLPGFKYENDKARLKPVFERCREIIQENAFDIELISGCELMATPDSLQWLREGRVATINDTQWLLLEIPWHESTMFDLDIDDYLRKVIKMGYKILIAHPERYSSIQNDYSILKSWRAMGCSFQLNRTSFNDDPNPKVRELAGKILEDGYCDIIASDAHRWSGLRVNKLSDTYAMLKTKYGEETARRLLIDNPQKVLDGLDL